MKFILHREDGPVVLVVTKGMFKAITVSDLLAIEIFSPVEQVEGKIDIQITFGEKTKIYL